ncbi:MAG: hypothetical protein QXF82_00525 [Nitrososphaeria archaeon]
MSYTEESFRRRLYNAGKLFGPESLTSKLFKEITEGRYNNVLYDIDEHKIFVSRPSGEKFPVGKLSKGTFDQLYMSIRIDLA